MRLNHYARLEGRRVIPVDSVEEMGRAFETERHVGDDTVGGYRVSTVFLCINHGGYGRKDRPLWFETMLFGRGARDQEMYRYSTYDEAEAGHKRLVSQLRNPFVRTALEFAARWYRSKMGWKYRRG